MPAGIRIHENLLRVCTGAVGNEHGVAKDPAVVNNSVLVRRPGKSDHPLLGLVQKRTRRTTHQRHQAKSGAGTAPQPAFSAVTGKASAAGGFQQLRRFALREIVETAGHNLSQEDIEWTVTL